MKILFALALLVTVVCSCDTGFQYERIPFPEGRSEDGLIITVSRKGVGGFDYFEGKGFFIKNLDTSSKKVGGKKFFYTQNLCRIEQIKIEDPNVVLVLQAFDFADSMNLERDRNLFPQGSGVILD